MNGELFSNSANSRSNSIRRADSPDPTTTTMYMTTVKSVSENGNTEEDNPHAHRVDTNSTVSSPRIRAMSGLPRSQVVQMRQLLRKLSILLISNVVISILCVAILARELGWGGGCVDLLVSNLCLWLTYKFNDKQYQRLCYLCIKFSNFVKC